MVKGMGSSMDKSKMQGILFIILAGFFFSLMTLFIRLSGDLPVMQKAFFRNIVAAVVSIVILARSDSGFKIQKNSWFGLFMRCFCGTTGLICNFYAVDRLGLADANMLNKMSPFFAVIFSIFILKEKVNIIEWSAVIIAFIGAAFVIKPSANITSFYGLIGLIGGLGAGIAYVFVRKLGNQGERGPVIVMCFSIFSTIVTVPFMLADFQPMSAKQLIMLLATGVAAAGGQLSITKAYTKAPAREISVFDYSQILFAATLGILFLGEFPDIYSIIGYVLIISVAIFKWWYNLNKDKINKRMKEV